MHKDILDTCGCLIGGVPYQGDPKEGKSTHFVGVESKYNLKHDVFVNRELPA